MKRNEEHLQTAYVQWLKTQHPKTLFTISPNGMKLPISVAVRFKRMGYSKGTPDVMIFEVRGNYHGLFIEFKSEDGRLTPEQVNWHTALAWRNYRTFVCYTIDEAIQVTNDYLKTC